MSLALKPIILFLVLCALNPFPSVESAIPSFIRTLQNLRGIHRGQNAEGVGTLRSYLKNLGYQVNDKSSSDNNFDANDESALKQYQAFHGLQTSGVVDDQTIETMSLPRCGLPDITATPNPNPNGLSSSPPQNFTFFPGNPKWSKFNLTYRTTRMPLFVSVGTNAFKQALSNAFNAWGENNSFTFTETTGQADIVVGFHRGFHFDFYPFDGPGGVLAHAFAPEDGRNHLDADENWSTTGTPPTIDLETVSLHEIGHNMGLAHSNDPNAVMAPTYTGVRRDLTQDDKDGLNNLYGF
ncbi:metalloendoproteinase 1-like [Vigna radiata var. radiata]|uniref:Metalloendoproteinase 1-like n=1 Tax=Vigna radiata var. radiata TaxID=3916 RepID=A0A1S3UR95_VIGRR|nr:metalloendoproteinase 1-like [Vigna radiata var. radiata]